MIVINTKLGTPVTIVIPAVVNVMVQMTIIALIVVLIIFNRLIKNVSVQMADISTKLHYHVLYVRHLVPPAPVR